MEALAELVAKEEIRQLAQLYSRGVDRKDLALLRTLYTDDAIDNHGPYSSGPVTNYYAFLERSLPHMPIGSHHICNHLVSVDGDTAQGEVYAIAWHLIPEPGPDREVLVRFDKMVAQNVAEVVWHKTQRLSFNPDGTLDFRVTVSGLGEISW